MQQLYLWALVLELDRARVTRKVNTRMALFLNVSEESLMRGTVVMNARLFRGSVMTAGNTGYPNSNKVQMLANQRQLAPMDRWV